MHSTAIMARREKEVDKALLELGETMTTNLDWVQKQNGSVQRALQYNRSPGKIRKKFYRDWFGYRGEGTPKFSYVKGEISYENEAFSAAT